MNFLTAVAVLFWALLANALTVSVLWAWFIVPPFGLPPLGLAESLGLSLLASYLTHQDKAEPKEPEAEPLRKVFISSTGRAIAALVLGWLVRLFL